MDEQNKLTFIDEEQSSRTQFLNEVLQGNEEELDGTIHQVSSIFLTPSKKGYIVTTPHFSVFLWKNDITTKSFLTMLDGFIKTPKKSYGVFIQIDTSTKKLYRIGVDKTVPCSWIKNEEGNYCVTPF